ncbi:hypothetical protein AAMO2058_000526000 [Amorphochlora amoebiformis]
MSLEANDPEYRRLITPSSQRTHVLVSEALEQMGYGKFQLRLLAFAGATQLADAMELLTISFLSHELKCPWGLGPQGAAGLQLAVLIGMGIGAIASGVVSDRHGRRTGSALAVLFTAVFGILSAFATNLPVLIILRFCVGIGVGAAPAPLGLYAEYLPQKRRGSQLIIFFTFFSFGAVLEACIAALTLGEGMGGWRGLLLVSALPSVLLAFVLPWIPESPRYLIEADRHEEAVTALSRVGMVNGSLKDVNFNWETVQFCLNYSKREIPCNSRKKSEENTWEILVKYMNYSPVVHERGTLRSLLTTQRMRPTLVLGAMMFDMAALYYSIVIASTSLLSPESNQNAHDTCNQAYPHGAFTRIIITNSAELPGLAAAAFLLERIGRKGSVSVCFLGCGVFMASLFVSPVSLRSFLLFGARASAQGFNVSLWVLATEFFPTSVRVLGVGMTTACARLGSILSPFIVEYLFESSLWLGVLACCILAFLGVVGSVFLPKDSQLAMKISNGAEGEGEVSEEEGEEIGVIG